MVWVVRIFSAFRWLLAAIGVIAIVLTALLAVPVTRPPELPSIRAGAGAIDQAGLPSLSYFQARDGTSLAYRLYPAADGNTQKIAIVVHGSAGHSTSMNEIAKRLATDNFTAVAPDMRGHGASGTRGDIGYLGQLDNDLQDLLTDLRREHHDAHFSLLGFSAGGGFALRVAAGKLASDFDRVVLLSPYLGYDAPSSRSSKGSAQWANADIPRIVALLMLRRLHFRCCEALPVIAFALRLGAEKFVTTRYSFRLLANFGPPPNLSPAFRRLKVPTTIIAGADDELMVPDKYSDIVAGIEPTIPVKILPGLGHMDMLHAPAAVDAISVAFEVK
jgi:alpha-beta hydrolase superfamily lysophospholipase